jgi:hypothetical protein
LLLIDAALEELGLQIDLNNLDKPLRQIGNGIDANSMRAFKPLRVMNPNEIQETILTSRDFVFIKVRTRTIILFIILYYIILYYIIKTIATLIYSNINIRY